MQLEIVGARLPGAGIEKRFLHRDVGSQETLAFGWPESSKTSLSLNWRTNEQQEGANRTFSKDKDYQRMQRLYVLGGTSGNGLHRRCVAPGAPYSQEAGRAVSHFLNAASPFFMEAGTTAGTSLECDSAR